MYLTSTSTLAGLDIDYADDFTWIYLGLWKSDFENEIFFWCQGIFFIILITKMAVKMKSRIITKNHEADP